MMAIDAQFLAKAEPAPSDSGPSVDGDWLLQNSLVSPKGLANCRFSLLGCRPVESQGFRSIPFGRSEDHLSTGLTAWRNRDTHESSGPIMELMVLAGEDAGNQFTLEGDLVLVGRGEPESGHTDVVRLEDKSISRRQAWLSVNVCCFFKDTRRNYKFVFESIQLI